MKETKPYDLPKQRVMDAWKCVKANKGAGGVDKESIEHWTWIPTSVIGVNSKWGL